MSTWPSAVGRMVSVSLRASRGRAAPQCDRHERLTTWLTPRTVLGFALAIGLAGIPVIGVADCPPSSSWSLDEIDAFWDELVDEIQPMVGFRELDFRIGGQRIFRARTRTDAFSGRDRIAERLRSLKPRLETLFAEIAAPTGRDVILVESGGETFSGTLAITDCWPPKPDDEDEGTAGTEGEHSRHWLMAALERNDPIPPDACTIIVYTDRIPSTAYLDFVLAHEWMHTRQVEDYSAFYDGGDWWREGAADWLGHKVVPGFTERDDVIARFFDEQRECPLTSISYPTQVFFFWGEREFDTRWVFEQGWKGKEWLREPARAAQVLPPERWLDWAKAEADGAITLPDGRALPASVPVEPIEIGSSACWARIEGPPLSVQVRAADIPADTEGPLRVETGGAQVAYRLGDDPWIDLPDGTVLDPVPSGPVTVTAIQPSDAPLSVTFTLGDERSGTGCDAECSAVPSSSDDCLVGMWQQADAATPDPKTEWGPTGVAGMTSYEAPPPIWTFFGDGLVLSDMPYSSTAEFSNGTGTARTTTETEVNRREGVWGAGGGRLVVCERKEVAQGRIVSEIVGRRTTTTPIDTNVELDPPNIERYTYTCSGDTLTVRGAGGNRKRGTWRRLSE